VLELRPICENCAGELAPDSTEARICSFECTFCRACAEGVLGNVCPNCGGGFVPRPVRPSSEWRSGVCLGSRPASEERKHKPVDADVHREFAAPIAKIPPHLR
jgi:hypothetical protein